MNRLNKTEPAVFLYCRFSLFLKDPVFQIILIFKFWFGKQVICSLKQFVPQWLSSIVPFDRKDELSHNEHCKCTIGNYMTKIYA